MVVSTAVTVVAVVSSFSIAVDGSRRGRGGRGGSGRRVHEGCQIPQPHVTVETATVHRTLKCKRRKLRSEKEKERERK